MIEALKTFAFIILLFTLSFIRSYYAEQPAEDVALRLLKEGNTRFVEGKSIHPIQSFDRVKEVSKAQRNLPVKKEHENHRTSMVL